MAYGPVNVPGSEATELEAVRKLAQTANETANTAKGKAETADNTANAALEAANNAAGVANAALDAANAASEAAGTANTQSAAAIEAANAAQETANGVDAKASEALTAAGNAQSAADAALAAVKQLTSSINAVPTQSGTLTYNGQAQSPSWNSYDPEQLTLGGVTSGTDAGTYTATFTPKEGYNWADGTTTAKSVTWTIARQSMTAPSQSGTLTYNGQAQSPTWSGYDSAKMTIGGTTSGTDAGTYTASFTPGANYQWSDGTTTAKDVTWSIGKAAGSLSVDPTSLTLDVSTLSKAIAVTRAGNGAISATSSNTAVATVSVSGTTVTVTAKAKGNANITIKVAAGTNHTAPADVAVPVTVDMPSNTLADNTPATIKAVAAAGNGASYWSVGDKIGIALNGTVGSLTLNDTYYAFILGFNHNEAYEGKGIDFQFGKTSGGVDIAFVDSGYGSSKTSGTWFNMNNSNTNSGGWSGSRMRTVVCPAFLAAMPTEWQNVIASATKYSDNTGGGNDTASQVTSTSDKIWLLAEFEVHGSRTYANSAEKNYQAQYAYYANGNSKVKYQHSATGSACYWWLRSVSATNATTFCYVSAGGSASTRSAYLSYGFAPGFKVA